MAVTKIAETILGADAASITFSSIPATYTHLRLVGRLRSARGLASNLTIQFNGDTTKANYRYEWLYGSGSSAVGGSGADNPVGMLAWTGVVADGFAPTTVLIPNYRRTTGRKLATGVSGTDSYAMVASASWNSTAAVTSVALVDTAGSNLVTGSILSLYGVT